MKTKLRFKELGFFIALGLGMLVSSCTKEVATIAPESELSTELTLKGAMIPSEDVVCDLIAGQSIIVGKVVYSHVGNQLLVEYATTGDWTLSEVHFYVGNMTDFKKTCINKKAIQIGKFPYSANDINAATFSFPITLIGTAPSDGYLVVAHAVVKNGSQEETAFAKCTYKPLITIKSHLLDNGNKTAAYSDGTMYKENSGDYCDWLGTNVYEKGDEYKYQSWDYPNGEAGKVTVNDDGDFLYVTVYSNFPITATYLFVGSIEELDAIWKRQPSGCPNYADFPYRKDSQLPESPAPPFIQSFSIPITMPSSITFNEAFESSRWGWLSYYRI